MSYGVVNAVRLNARDMYYLADASYRRLSLNKSVSNVLCNSYPKSGTHLLHQILKQVPEYSFWNDIVSVQALSGVMNTKNHLKWKLASAPNGSIIRSHLMHCPEVLEVLAERKYRKIFIHRDLRDVALSHAKWVVKEPRIFLHKIYNEYYTSDDARLMASICGVPLGTPFGSNVSHPSIGQDFSRWHGWLSDKDTLVVRFEDLVGSRGGGDDDVRWAAIRRILTHIEVEMSDSELHSKFSFEALNPRSAHTFRKGQIGGWKEVYTMDHVEAFKRVAGDMLIDLGYESNLTW